MKVFDIMSEHIVTVGLGEPVAAAARLFPHHRGLDARQDRGICLGVFSAALSVQGRLRAADLCGQHPQLRHAL